MSIAYVSDSQMDFERAVSLLDAYRASELAHRRAADAVGPDERARLLRRAHERARFAREIDTELRALGCPEPDDFRASDSRDARDARQREADGDDAGSQIRRAEDQVLSEIERALAGTLPEDLTSLVERHARAIRTALTSR